MSGVFLEFGYTASKLQSLFGRRDQEQRSQIAKRRKDERKREKEKKKIYCKCFSWALDFGFNQSVKEYGLLRAMKPEDRQCYQFVKVTI